MNHLTSPRNHAAIILVFLITLVLTALPLPVWAQEFRPQWTALALIYWCLALPERVGIGSGWSLGLLQDILTGTLLGQHALCLSVVAFLVLKLYRRIRIFPLWQQALIVLVLLVVERLLGLWIIGASGQPTPTLGYWMPVFSGALLWPWVYIVLRDVRRRFHVGLSDY